MQNFQFISPTQFVFGTNAELQCGSWLKEHQYTNVLVVCGQGHVKTSGLLDRVLNSLSEYEISYQLLEGVRPNPEVTSARLGVALCKEHGCDFVLAVGGGSVIDASKAIALGAYYSGDVWDLYKRPNPEFVNHALPVGSVLTIPAAGSEASSSSVLSNDELGLKTSAGGDMVRPQVAFMNPELTLSLSSWQTFAGITDMIAHICERFFSKTPTTTATDYLALAMLKAIRTDALVLAKDPQNYDARANIMWLSTLAHNGLAGLGRSSDWTSHALEHEMSALKPEVTHGAGLAVIMPAWMRFVAPQNPERFALFGAEVFGLARTANTLQDAYNAIDTLQNFLTSVGMPSSLEAFGFCPEDIDRMVAGMALTRGEVFGDFKELTLEDAREIYLSAFQTA